MAFIEKVTNMRRCAVIDMGNGAIKYEGVNIEGKLIMKKYGWCDNEIAIVEEEEVKRWLENLSNHLVEYKLVYQDKVSENWIPREKYKKFRP